MKRYRRLVPSTSRLIAFSAVAKTGNITAAADLLGLTQAAVSRQLRELEDFIGRPLAIRSSKGVRLTQARQRLIAELPGALDQICDAVEAAAAPENSSSLTVFCDHSLTTTWLSRKILEFERQHPEIKVQVLSSNRRPSVFAGQFDLAVLYGRPDSGTFQSKPICPDRVFPVAAPSVLATLPAEKSLDALLDYPLLDISETRRDWLTWPDFLKAHGIAKPPKPKTVFDSYAIALEAARLGHGLLLGWELVIENHLADGSLQSVGPWSLDCPGGLRLHFNHGQMIEPASIFMQWLCPSDETEVSG
ncbi:MAG: LysR family transcriptional regulator [Rhodobacteraceae bacterium]|nr:LysR family transcriptional regulator [Paracoccaceae bacterium]